MHIYKNHFSALCDFGIRYAPSHMVEDAVQDLFLHLRKKRQDLPLLKNALSPFLCQCLKKRLFNMQKHSKRIYDKKVDDKKIDFVPSIESNILVSQDQKEKLIRLHKLLSGFEIRHYHVIHCYFFQGMSNREVGEMLGFQDVKSSRN